MNITEEEIAAMKARLKSRQAERRQDAEDAEVFGLLRNREPAGSHPTAAPVPAAGRPEKIGAVPLYGTATAGALVAAVMNGILRNWLFELVLGMAAYAAVIL